MAVENKLSQEEIIQAIENMTVLELSQLVRRLRRGSASPRLPL